MATRSTLLVQPPTKLRCMTSNGARLSAVSMPPTPSGLALSRTGSVLYVTCAALKSKICIVLTATGKVNNNPGCLLILRWPRL